VSAVGFDAEGALWTVAGRRAVRWEGDEPHLSFGGVRELWAPGTGPVVLAAADRLIVVDPNGDRSLEAPPTLSQLVRGPKGQLAGMLPRPSRLWRLDEEEDTPLAVELPCTDGRLGGIDGRGRAWVSCRTMGLVVTDEQVVAAPWPEPTEVSPDGRWGVRLEPDQSTVVDLHTDQPLGSVSATGHQVRWSADSAAFLLGGAEGWVRVDTATRAVTALPALDAPAEAAVAIGADGQLVVARGAAVDTHDPMGRQLTEWAGHRWVPHLLAAGAAGDWALTADPRELVIWWHRDRPTVRIDGSALPDPQARRRHPLERSAVGHAVVDAEERVAVVALEKGMALVIDLATGQLLHALPLDQPPDATLGPHRSLDVEARPRDNAIASCGPGAHLGPRVVTPRLSADGRWLTTLGWWGDASLVQLWDLSRGEVVRLWVFDQRTNLVGSLPDERVVVHAGDKVFALGLGAEKVLADGVAEVRLGDGTVWVRGRKETWRAVDGSQGSPPEPSCASPTTVASPEGVHLARGVVRFMDTAPAP